MNHESLQKMARRKFQRLRRQKKDRRFLETMGCFIAAGLLDHPTIPTYRGFVRLEDALWAGTLEPRILELLPAVLLKIPRLLRYEGGLPEDLQTILKDLRNGQAQNDFRGIPMKTYARWIPRLGHQGKSPSLVKNFRFSQDDLELLKRLKTKHRETEIGIIRKGLRTLDEETAGGG